MKEQGPWGEEHEFSTRGGNYKRSEEKMGGSDAEKQTEVKSKQNELPQWSWTIHMKDSDHRYYTSNICNQKEVGICMEFYLWLLSIFKVILYMKSVSPKDEN